jgi:hypothetical protein
VADYEFSGEGDTGGDHGWGVGGCEDAGGGVTVEVEGDCMDYLEGGDFDGDYD